MSSINPGFGPQSLPSSLSGISPSGKNSSAQKSEKADGAAAKTVESANAHATGLHGSEKSDDRDADGRQFYQSEEQQPPGAPLPGEPAPAPRSTDPQKQRGTRLDLDA